jgi:hypothetical protein
VTAGASELRSVLRGLPGGTLVLAVPRAAQPATRRVAGALLDEAAAFGGGHRAGLPAAELLVGTSPAAAARAAEALADIAALAARSFIVPEETGALEAWVAAQPPPAPAEAGIAALEARCAALPLEAAASLTFFAEGESERPVAQRLGPAPFPVEDAELAEQARDWLCRRVLGALTDPRAFAKLPPLRPGLRLLLDLPGAALPGGGMMGGGGGGAPPIALLPAATLGAPGQAARAAQLEAAGWRVAHLAADAALAAAWRGPGLLAAPPPEEASPALGGGFIALGRAHPAWCRAPGILRELPGRGPGA